MLESLVLLALEQELQVGLVVLAQPELLVVLVLVPWCCRLCWCCISRIFHQYPLTILVVVIITIVQYIVMVTIFITIVWVVFQLLVDELLLLLFVKGFH